MTNLTDDDLKTLTQWDTPTICNALEITSPDRRGFGFSVHPFVCLDPALPPIVGYARTAKIRAAQPATGDVAGNRIPYYEYVAEAPGPTIVVIEDIDPKPGVGAFWGEVHTTVHKGLGALGVVTNGSFRDITDSAPGFQALGGMVGPSHAFVHPVDFNCPVTVHGMEVEHGDIIHADQHGAVVVPADAVRKIPAAVDLITRREAKILDAARADDFDIEKLKQAIGASGDIH
ncbi:MAG: RraA family protein [Rhodospirillaceae bacterium]|jgi:regulator of RNase E activity RraA|nr:RraA family protein [Rhodospirillaceae bacterium]